MLARYDFEFRAWPVDWRMGENGYVVCKRKLVCLSPCHKSLRKLISYCMRNTICHQRETCTLDITNCACTCIYPWQEHVVKHVFVIFPPTILLQKCYPSQFFL